MSAADDDGASTCAAAEGIVVNLFGRFEGVVALCAVPSARFLLALGYRLDQTKVLAFAAFGTFLARCDGHNDAYDYGPYNHAGHEYENGHQIVVVRIVVTNNCAIAADDLVEGAHRFEDGCVPVCLFQLGHHDAVFHAAADGIGQGAFQSVARQDLVRAVLGGKDDDEARVLLVANAVLARQVHTEGEGVVAIQVLDHDDNGLHALVHLEAAQDAVGGHAGRVAHHAIGVAYVLGGVLEIHHLEVVHVPFLCQGGEGYGEQEGTQEEGFELLHRGEWLVPGGTCMPAKV